MQSSTLIGIILIVFLFLFLAGIISSNIDVDMPYGNVTAWDLIIDSIESLLPDWLQAIL